MSGHWLCRVRCFVLGHGERVWTVTDKGGGWRCLRCFHIEPSRAVWVRRRLS